jgi:protein-tyrosine phosphatase
MFDLHSHLLPGVDDGAENHSVALDMARAYVEQGVQCVACTPHILPGLYPNTGADIRRGVEEMQARLDDAGIALKLVAGADNHLVPHFAEGLKCGHLLTLADSAFVLVEPPHDVAPLHLEGFFFNLILEGYVPVLTHPERLSWIEFKFELIEKLAKHGVWMQVTSGSLRGVFGRRARYWAERLLCEGLVHILATDAHNMTTRRPDLLQGLAQAERLVGPEEARRLVVTRPYCALSNMLSLGALNPTDGQAIEELRGYDGSGQTYATPAGDCIAQRM